jgi:hypothetical protein
VASDYLNQIHETQKNARGKTLEKKSIPKIRFNTKKSKNNPKKSQKNTIITQKNTKITQKIPPVPVESKSNPNKSD